MKILAVIMVVLVATQIMMFIFNPMYDNISRGYMLMCCIVSIGVGAILIFLFLYGEKLNKITNVKEKTSRKHQ